eukprot:84946_1
MTTTWDMLQIVSLTLLLISFILCVLILLSLIIGVSKSNHNTKSVVFKTTYFCIIAYVSFDVLFITNQYVIKYELVTYWVMSCVYGLIWEIAQLLIYVLLMLRLSHSFKDTKYAISKVINIIFIILIIMYSLSCMIYIIKAIISIDEYKQQKYIINPRYSVVFDMSYNIGLAFFDLIISILLIALFIRKMMEVTIDLRIHQTDALVNDRISRLNQQQKFLLDITAKYFVLSFVATLWTQVVILLYLLGAIMNYFEWKVAVESINAVAQLFWITDGIVNPICLYLIFEMNDKWYQRICRGCHAFSRLCFRKCTVKTAEKKYKNLELSLQTNLLE